MNDFLLLHVNSTHCSAIRAHFARGTVVSDRVTRQRLDSSTHCGCKSGEGRPLRASHEEVKSSVDGAASREMPLPCSRTTECECKLKAGDSFSQALAFTPGGVRSDSGYYDRRHGWDGVPTRAVVGAKPLSRSGNVRELASEGRNMATCAFHM